MISMSLCSSASQEKKMNPDTERTQPAGMIFDLKRFAVHDGGGLRSTLFLKGCPLRCPWCQNPEGLEKEPLLWYDPSQCMRCATCVSVCPQNALSMAPANGDSPERIHMVPSACSLCGKCEEACPAAAIEVRGRKIGVQEAVSMLLRDRIFFRDSGGVTLSGGEVLLQWEFAAAVLAECKAQGADTAIETSLMGPPRAVEELMKVTDHFLIDIKIFDPEKHRQIIGTDNRRILANYEMLLYGNADVLVRTPLIPGYTADDENIRSIARYIVSQDPDTRYELLNYNPLCRSKYEALERPYPVDEIRPLSAEEMEHFYEILREEHVPHIIT